LGKIWVSTLLYDGDKILLAESVNELRVLLYGLGYGYSLLLYTNFYQKSKVMTLCEKQHIRSKIAMNDQSIEQVQSFTFLTVS
jgi:hypothetical protein